MIAKQERNGNNWRKPLGGRESVHVILSCEGITLVFQRTSHFIENMAAPSRRASSVKDDVSRILKLCRAELQQLNLDRVFSELEQKNILSKGITNVLKRKSASEKSNVLITVLQSRNPKDFQTFLEVVSNESDIKFKEPTKEFLTMVSIYPGYEHYYCDLDSKTEEAVERDETGK